MVSQCVYDCACLLVSIHLFCLPLALPTTTLHSTAYMQSVVFLLPVAHVAITGQY